MVFLGMGIDGAIRGWSLGPEYISGGVFLLLFDVAFFGAIRSGVNRRARGGER
jgi:hypothetical protein